MFPFTLKFTETKQYTPLPSPIIDHIMPWLKRNVPDFKIVKNEDAPDWVPRTHVFNGRESIIGTAYVYANLEPAELIKAAEKMSKMMIKDL